jgi:hypothetical protein
LALLLPAFALPPGEAHGQSFAGCRTLVTPPFEAVTFDRDIQAVFDRACIDCDNPGASEYSRHQLDLRRGHAYLALVNVPSRADPAFPRVQPFWPDGEVGSLLWWKVSCLPPPTGQAMPPPPARLLAEELRAIYTWILRGAPASDPRESGRRQPDASLSGIWFDPSVRGQGFSLHITDESPARAFLFWTTFGAGQDPAQGPDNRWIAGAGTVGPDPGVLPGGRRRLRLRVESQRDLPDGKRIPDLRRLQRGDPQLPDRPGWPGGSRLFPHHRPATAGAVGRLQMTRPPWRRPGRSTAHDPIVAMRAARSASPSGSAHAQPAR